jgi:hypothetical protein
VRAAARLFPALLVFWLGSPAARAEDKPRTKGSPAAQKTLQEAAQLLKANRLEQGIERLQAVIQTFPKDPAAEKARELLRENGVGDGLRVQFKEREVFRTRLKITEGAVLASEEKVLETLRPKYKGLKPYFKESDLLLVFYDSQARYRENGGSITSSGHFGVIQADFQAGKVHSKISWHFPKEATTPKDREIYQKSLLYHESTHYLNAIHFAAALPEPIDEGLATYFQSRLNTDTYQHYRQTDRDRLEKDARLGLNSIKRYEDFLRLLDSPRGFGQGDVMIDRWYGLTYAVVDFFAEAEIDSRKGSLEKLLQKLWELTAGEAGKLSQPGPVPRLATRAVLESVVSEFYGVKLPDFHRELLKSVVARYKPRT